LKPSPFQYYAPESIGDVVSLLTQYGDEAKPLAGGQSLVPMMSLRLVSYRHLVDLRRVRGLDAIDRVDGRVRVGAMVRQAVAEKDPAVAAVPLLAKSIPHIGHFQIRNRGTVGGSIAHADPASELPAVVLALDAVLEATGPSGPRQIPASSFFESTWQTSLEQAEVLTAVEFPLWLGASGFAVEEVARRHGDFALVGAVVGVTLESERITRAAIAMLGVGATPVRCHDAEAALIAGGTAADLMDVGRAAAAGLHPIDDVHASAAYRKHVAPAIVRRALARALEEARS
jgi:carbon-monoxide dehydrogenase medium subunit